LKDWSVNGETDVHDSKGIMKRPLLVATLARAERVRSYRIEPTSDGWEVCAREGQRVLEARVHADWHRVEHTLERFRVEIDALRAEGWRDL
jgi:hypothetical protein